MAGLKKRVNGFVLENSRPGAHHYYLRQDIAPGEQMIYEVIIHDGVNACDWAVDTGGWYEGDGRTPEQMESIERFGAPWHCAASWDDAKRKAYSFMKRFSGSPDYNGLIDLAAEAGFRREDGGSY